MSARWVGTPSTARRFRARSSAPAPSCRRTAPPMSPLIPVTSTTGRSIGGGALRDRGARSEEHTSELQSPFLISYAVFCLKKKKERRVFRPPHQYSCDYIVDD